MDTSPKTVAEMTPAEFAQVLEGAVTRALCNAVDYQILAERGYRNELREIPEPEGRPSQSAGCGNPPLASFAEDYAGLTDALRGDFIEHRQKVNEALERGIRRTNGRIV